MLHSFYRDWIYKNVVYLTIYAVTAPSVILNMARNTQRNLTRVSTYLLSTILFFSH